MIFGEVQRRFFMCSCSSCIYFFFDQFSSDTIFHILAIHLSLRWLYFLKYLQQFLRNISLYLQAYRLLLQAYLCRSWWESGKTEWKLKNFTKSYCSEVSLNYRNKIKGQKLNFALQLFSSTVLALVSQLAALRDPRGVMEAPALWHI